MAVAADTVPVPELNAIVLFSAVDEKFVPTMLRVVAFCARLAVLTVTVGTGTMVATCTAVPLLAPREVTTAVKLPNEGAVFKVTVNCVAVAIETVPVPVLSATVLLLAVVEKLVPAMISVVLFCARFAVLVETVGTGTTVAT